MSMGMAKPRSTFPTIASNYRLAPNFLWFFDDKKVLKDRAMELGVAGNPGPPVKYGNGMEIRCCGHTIGSCVADFDNDSHLDLLVANFSHPPEYQNRTQFLRNGGPPNYRFEDKSKAVKLRRQESYAVAVAGDVDKDGLVDFFLTTVYAGDSIVLYHNQGDWRFVEVTMESGVATATTYQAAFADIKWRWLSRFGLGWQSPDQHARPPRSGDEEQPFQDSPERSKPMQSRRGCIAGCC
jgi:hypothetical protein